jgi:hypothetical protein
MAHEEALDLALVPVVTGSQIRPPEPVAGSSCSSTAAKAASESAK